MSSIRLPEDFDELTERVAALEHKRWEGAAPTTREAIRLANKERHNEEHLREVEEAKRQAKREVIEDVRQQISDAVERFKTSRGQFNSPRTTSHYEDGLRDAAIVLEAHLPEPPDPEDGP